MSEFHPSSSEFFEEKYQQDASGDPWRFATDSYELGRYAAVIEALSGRRFAHAFEPGCSVGVLTQKLAAICDLLDACDCSATATGIAAARCAALSGVRVRCARLTGGEPWEQFDLVILCEIGYYFTGDEWADLVERMVSGMRPATTLLAAHWLGHSVDHLQSGDAVHQALRQPLLLRTLSERHEGFVLERWTRLDESR